MQKGWQNPKIAKNASKDITVYPELAGKLTTPTIHHLRKPYLTAIRDNSVPPVVRVEIFIHVRLVHTQRIRTYIKHPIAQHVPKVTIAMAAKRLRQVPVPLVISVLQEQRKSTKIPALLENISRFFIKVQKQAAKTAPKDTFASLA